MCCSFTSCLLLISGEAGHWRWARVPDDAALVAPAPLHVAVTAVSDGEDVGGQLAQLGAVVEPHMLGRVDGQHLVWVHRHQDGARVRLQGREERIRLQGPQLGPIRLSKM